LAGWPWLPATAAAVEGAVLHNFVWHEWWTWGDRRFGRFGGFGRFARFNIATGLISIVGNLVVMEILVESLGLPPLIGNAISVGLLSVANFLVSDRWVFPPPSPAGFGEAGPPSPTGFGMAGLVALVLLSPVRATAGPSQATLRAWDAYVAQAEARL